MRFIYAMPFLALFFVACSDDTSSEVVDVYDDVNQILASGKKLKSVDCDSTNIGEKLFGADSGASYFCDGHDWNLLKGGDGKQGKQGADGKKGAQGDKGAKGDSAQTKGETGANGEKGEAGDSSKVNCGVASDSAGVIVLKCSDGEPSVLYTALCGNSGYDPEKQFCFQGKLYNSTEFLIDSRDNQVYRIALFGKGDSARTWMVENLNYALNEGEQSWCYDNNEENCQKYGRLYTWAAVLNRSEEECGYGQKCNVANPFRGLCPEGWHVSTKDEWQMLFKLEKEKDTAGEMLRSKTGWKEDVKGTDALGFAALPGGYYEEGVFHGKSETALFWTSNFIDKFSAQSYGMTYDSKDVTYEALDEDMGLSLRCVKNDR